MSFNYNKVQLAGNLTRDPQVRFLANERAVADFGLAVNRQWKDTNGEKREEVAFIDVESFGRTAELVGQYLTKGSPCFIEGRLRLDTWEDKKTGEKRSKIKVVAESVQFTGAKKEHDQHGADAAPDPQKPQKPAAAKPDDEPPF